MADKGDLKVCLLKEVSKSPVQAAALAALGKAKEKISEVLEKKPKRVETAADAARKMGGMGMTSQAAAELWHKPRKQRHHNVLPLSDISWPRKAPFSASVLSLPGFNCSGYHCLLSKQGNTPLSSSPTHALNYFLWSGCSLVSNTL